MRGERSCAARVTGATGGSAMSELLSRPPRSPQQVVGVVNVSPESVKRISVVAGVDGALRLARRYRRYGVELLDVGGRSSSPVSPLLDDRTEQERVLPVIVALRSEGFRVSVDTW